MSSRRQVLLDSNVIIYAANTPGGTAASFVAGIDPVASVVTRIEVLGFHQLDPANKAALEAYFQAVTVVPLDDIIVDRAIALRQTRRMALGDAIIAATALECGLELATRNVTDFRWITGLHVIDPFASPPPP